MDRNPHSVRTVWRGALKDIRQRRVSFFFTALIAPLTFWGLMVLINGLGPPQLVRSLIPVILQLIIGILSAILLLASRKRRYRNHRLQRMVALVHRIYFGILLLGLSAYMLRVALDFATRQTTMPSWIISSLFALYAVSAAAAIAWAPSSLPRSSEDDVMASQRGIRWLPWVMGVQGALVGVGVFLGAWFMHSEITWGGLLLVGLTSLAAILLVMFSILGLYRFVVLAQNPIPQEVRDEFNLDN